MITDTKQLCTFYLDGDLFGVDALSVQEVIRYQEMTSVPLTPTCFAGLINLRGQVVTAVDMRKRLGLSERIDGAKPMNVVIRTEDGPVSLLVDQIGDVVEVHDTIFEPPPDTLQGPAKGFVLGAYKLEHRLLLLLNANEAVDLTQNN